MTCPNEVVVAKSGLAPREDCNLGPRHRAPWRQGPLGREREGLAGRTGVSAAEGFVVFENDLGDLPNLDAVLRVTAHIGTSQRELREVGVVPTLRDARRQVSLATEDNGDDEPPGTTAEQFLPCLLQNLHASELAAAIGVTFVAWGVNHNHADALADGVSQRLIVTITGLEPFLVNVDLLVEERLQLRLERQLELLDEALREFVLAVTVTDEARVLERHRHHLPAPGVAWVWS